MASLIRWMLRRHPLNSGYIYIWPGGELHQKTIRSYWSTRSEDTHVYTIIPGDVVYREILTLFETINISNWNMALETIVTRRGLQSTAWTGYTKKELYQNHRTTSIYRTIPDSQSLETIGAISYGRGYDDISVISAKQLRVGTLTQIGEFTTTRCVVTDRPIEKIAEKLHLPMQGLHVLRNTSGSVIKTIVDGIHLYNFALTASEAH